MQKLLEFINMFGIFSQAVWRMPGAIVRDVRIHRAARQAGSRGDAIKKNSPPCGKMGNGVEAAADQIRSGREKVTLP